MGLGKDIDTLLKLHNSNPNDIAKRIGVPRSSIYSMIRRDNAKTSIDLIIKICDELGVSSDDFLKKYKVKGNESSLDNFNLILSEHEKDLIKAYRNNPAMQTAIDRLLKIEKVETIAVYRAARSDNNHEDEIVSMTAERLQKLRDAPETDDDL